MKVCYPKNEYRGGGQGIKINPWFSQYFCSLDTCVKEMRKLCIFLLLCLFLFRGVLKNPINVFMYQSTTYTVVVLQEVASVYSILAAILHTGNISFDETESKHHTSTGVANAARVDIGKLS